MKSIDEFATKYAQDKYLPVQTYNAVKAGSNYVLEEIEKLVKFNRWTAQDLYELIEQLKK